MSSPATERAVSLAALFVAVCAVVVSAVEAKMNRDQQKNSVWPYIIQGNSFAEKHYRRLVWSAGLGPARVRSFQVRVDGKVMHRWMDVLRGLGVTNDDPGLMYSTLRRGSVLLPNVPHELFTLPPGEVSLKVVQASGRMATRICFCSLYDDCWVSDTGADDNEPAKVASCPALSNDEFQQ